MTIPKKMQKKTWNVIKIVKMVGMALGPKNCTTIPNDSWVTLGFIVDYPYELAGKMSHLTFRYACLMFQVFMDNNSQRISSQFVQLPCA